MEFQAKVDVRTYEPKKRHPIIFETFDRLQSGQQMELTNDHDPRPLRYTFMMERSEQFDWRYLEEGPDVWRVAIKKM
ncbi:hypothetical protein BEP19_08325 [Ammoniphilus oxalaticus]|uniref:DUF2249 domain-containing protein n=1 Tax=Ammoniphilus oxalaticus TaxID=66863 RepID=A0A419SKC7_9BACL|nr:DUF2249 domain-containing protein [Ammoniphilus oxalaticus]RKD24389.1 hypothetical protein BEP19_08325 [Ammoniphilus oxalaticus]